MIENTTRISLDWTSMQAKVDSLQTDLEKNKKQIEDLKTDVANRDQLLERILPQFERLINKNDQVEQEKQELGKQFCALTTTQTILIKGMEKKFQDECESMNKRNQEIEGNLADMSRLFQKSRNEISSLLEKCKQLEEENLELRRLNADNKNQRNEIYAADNQKIKDLTKNFEHLQNRISELEEENRILRQKEEEKNSFRQRNARLEEQIVQLRKEKLQLDHSNGQLMVQVTQYKEENDKLIKRIEEDLKRRTQTVQQMRDQNSELSKKLLDLLNVKFIESGDMEKWIISMAKMLNLNENEIQALSLHVKGNFESLLADMRRLIQEIERLKMSARFNSSLLRNLSTGYGLIGLLIEATNTNHKSTLTFSLLDPLGLTT